MGQGGVVKIEAILLQEIHENPRRPGPHRERATPLAWQEYRRDESLPH